MIGEVYRFELYQSHPSAQLALLICLQRGCLSANQDEGEILSARQQVCHTMTCWMKSELPWVWQGLSRAERLAPLGWQLGRVTFVLGPVG